LLQLLLLLPLPLPLLLPLPFPHQLQLLLQSPRISAQFSANLSGSAVPRFRSSTVPR